MNQTNLSFFRLISVIAVSVISPIIFKSLKNLSKNILNFSSSENFAKINWEIFNIPEEEIDREKYLFSELNLKEKKSNNNIDKNNHKIVIGIDFGTIDSGYSYTLLFKIIFIDKKIFFLIDNRIFNYFKFCTYYYEKL